MRRLAWMLCLGVLWGGTPPRAQVPDPAPRPIGPDEWPTFRAGTRLATIDAVVVDAPPMATATLLRDGAPIFTSPAAPVAAAPRGGSGVRAVPISGRLTLGRQLSPGRYTLQVSIPRPDSPARAQASQWTEFEVR